MTSQSRNFFDEIYKVSSSKEQFDLYSEWAKSYEMDVVSNGYKTPIRCAKALREVVRNLDISILDVGCGTGYSGLAFHNEGFRNITGTDINPEMVNIASQKNFYKQVELGTIETPLPQNASKFEVIAAVGVIGAGAAGLDLLDRIIDVSSKQGVIVLSLNDHTLSESDYEARIEQYLRSMKIIVRYKGYGEHMVNLNLGSMVYVLEKI